MDKQSTCSTTVPDKEYTINTKKYKVIKQLGKGTYGSVYLATDTSDPSKTIAIKKIKLGLDKEGIPTTALRELAILSRYKHINIVSLFDVALHESRILLCMEFIDFNLDTFIKTKAPSLSADRIKQILYQITLAIDYLHGNKVLHRDLKPMNILLTKDFVVKIADFGLSRIYSLPVRPYTKEVLTLWYRSPELILGVEAYSTGIDMWSVGCIMAELYLLKAPFRGDSEVGQLFEIFQVLGSPSVSSLPGYKDMPNFNSDFPYWKGSGLFKLMEKSRIDNKGLDLLSKLLCLNPIERITAREALKHSYFQGVEETLSFKYS